MLQRGLPSVLMWGPALTAGCQLQQTSAQIASACSFVQSFSSNGSFSSGDILQQTSQQQQQRERSTFSSKTVDVTKTVPQPRRAKLPYFNPDDGPQAYHYWRDLWANPKPQPKIKRVRRQPLYLEDEEQQALLDAAVGAGIPLEIVQGDMAARQVPRLIAAIQRKGGRIPTDPALLAARIEQLLQLQRAVPGLDVMRILKAKGFGILAESPKKVQQKVKLIQFQLAAAGVSTEPGVLLTAAVKPALHYPIGLVNRVRQLPQVFETSLDAPAPANFLQHPFAANILNRSTRALQQDMEALARRQGKAAAASMFSKLPQLLLFKSQTLHHKTTALAGALDLEIQQVNNMVKRHPRLLTFSAETLTERVESLAQLLGVLSGQERVLQQVVLQQPSLLYKKSESVARKLSMIQQQLGLANIQQAADALKQSPMLASHSTAHLQQALQQLQRLDDTSLLAPLKSKAQDILRAKPWLLTLGSNVDIRPRNSISGRVQLLEQVAGLNPSWKDVVLRWVNSNSEDIAAVLGHKDLVDRVTYVLRQQQQQRENNAVPAAAAAAAPATAATAESEVVGLYAFVMKREARFEKQYPGFVAWKQQHLQ